jgi:large subunit ribosomal protein L4
MELPIHNLKGEVVGKAQVDETVFAAALKPDLLHQALVRVQANQRQGTSSTLTRGLVSGGGRKPWKQKGTGRARQGSTRSPQWRHGGVVFGPHPRSYRKDMPKRMRREALRVALSTKAAGERLILVEGLTDLEPKTKALAALLEALGVTSSALMVLREPAEGVVRSARNLPRTKALAADLLNVLDLARYDAVVMSPEAAARAGELWSQTASRRKQGLTKEAAA